MDKISEIQAALKSAGFTSKLWEKNDLVRLYLTYGKKDIGYIAFEDGAWVRNTAGKHNAIRDAFATVGIEI